MVVGDCHRILRRAGPLCRACRANKPSESLNRPAASPMVTPAAFGTKSGSNIAYLSNSIPPNTPAPGLVPDRWIRGFLFCISASGRVSKIWPICAQNGQEGLAAVRPGRRGQPAGGGARLGWGKKRAWVNRGSRAAACSPLTAFEPLAPARLWPGSVRYTPAHR